MISKLNLDLLNLVIVNVVNDSGKWAISLMSTGVK